MAGIPVAALATPRGRAAVRTKWPAAWAALCAAPTRSPATLRALTALLVDVDAALEFGYRGGQGRLSRALLAAASSSDADALDAIGGVIEVCAAALPPGVSFPMEPGLDLLYPPPPAVFQLPPIAMSADAAGGDAAVLDAWVRGRDTASCLGVGAGAWVEYDPGVPPPPHTVQAATPPQPATGSMMATPPPLYFRSVAATQHRLRSQDDVGQLLWPAALVMARWLAAHGVMLPWTPPRGAATVLEVGAGMGLTGIAAAAVGGALAQAAGCTPPAVTLTDFNDLVLHNAAYNAALNSTGDAPAAAAVREMDWRVYAPPYLPDAVAHYRASRLARFTGGGAPPPSGSGGGAAGVSGSSSSVAAAAAAATTETEEEAEAEAGTATRSPPRLPAHDTFDVVLATDVVVSVEDAYCVAGAMAAHLAPGGVGIIAVPPPEVRWGVEALPDALARAGLQAVARVVDAGYTVDAVSVGGGSDTTAAALAIAGGYEARLRLVLVRRPPATPASAS